MSGQNQSVGFSISSGDTGETHARRCHDARSEIGGTWEGFEYLLLLLVPEGFGSGKGSGIISETVLESDT